MTNAVWVSEALNQLNHETTSNDERICTAIDVFFEDYVRSLKPRRNAKKVLEKLKPHFALGLVSNFTYAPVIHASLGRLGLTKYFQPCTCLTGFWLAKAKFKGVSRNSEKAED